MGPLPYIPDVWGRVYLRLMLYIYIYSMYIPRRILGIIIMERRGGQYSVTNCQNVGAMLGCRCDVSAFNLRRSMCRPSKSDDRCVNLRRSMCQLSKINDRCADLRRSMACRPSKADDRCEIMLPHLLETLMV